MIRNLDLMRAVAVLLVLVGHLMYFFQASVFPKLYSHGLNPYAIGRWGVLIFFVHTSFVLMSSIERQIERMPEAPVIPVFYVRRMFRIYPLSILVVLFVTISHIPVWDFKGVFREAHLHPSQILENVFLVQNLRHTDSAVAVLWSLPFEMQMYLILPVLFFVVSKSRTILPMLGVWACTALLARASFHFGKLDFLVFAPCFIPGVLAYKLTKNHRAVLPFVLWPAAFGCLTLAYVLSPAYTTNSLNRNGWFCCLCLGLAIPWFREMPEGWLQWICNRIARYSYGIYLLHLVCLWLAFGVLSGIPMFARWIVFLVSTAGSSVLVYHTVEAPMIAMGNRWIKPRAPQPLPQVEMETPTPEFQAEL